MGQPIVRGLDDRLVRTLKQRAVRAGRSTEAEHRGHPRTNPPTRDGNLRGRRRATAETDAAADHRQRRSDPAGSGPGSRGRHHVREVVVHASDAAKWVVEDSSRTRHCLALPRPEVSFQTLDLLARIGAARVHIRDHMIRFAVP
jgi:hypothetical protein